MWDICAKLCQNTCMTLWVMAKHKQTSLPYDICRWSVVLPLWYRCCRPRGTGTPLAQSTYTSHTHLSPARHKHTHTKFVATFHCGHTDTGTVHKIVCIQIELMIVSAPSRLVSGLLAGHQAVEQVHCHHTPLSHPVSHVWSGWDWRPGLDTPPKASIKSYTVHWCHTSVTMATESLSRDSYYIIMLNTVNKPCYLR